MSKSAEGGEKDIDPLHVYSFSTALLVAVMIAWSTLGHKLAGRSKLLGEGSAACLMGLAAGLILLVCEKLFLHPEVLQGILSFDPENFFIFFLPPIIFYAGLSVKKKHFFRNFFTIAGYGVIGTYVCFALISTFLYLFVGQLSFGDCLALGAILAATDSVAALQVISQDRFPLLYSVVFGEGVLNDATSIVILGTLQELQLDNVKDLTFAVVMRILGEFLYLAVASSLLGLFFGLLTAFCLRKMHIQHTAQEVALIGLTAYLSYLMGDVFELSGILALFVSAVAISHYALHNISTESRTTTIYSFQTLSYISEGIIFVYCGMDALDPLKWKNTSIKELLWMFWILIILLVVTRAIFVVPVTFLHNRFAQHKLETRDMIVIWWAGLMRGAVSVALVYYYFDPHGTTQDAHTSTMITTTLIVVLISIILFGALTKPLLEKVMGPQVADTTHCAKDGVELAHTPQSPSRRLGGNDYMAVGDELSADPSPDGASESDPQPTATILKHQPSGVPVYQDDDFSPLTEAVPARAPSDGLHEVAIDPSPRSMTAAAGSPEAKKSQKIMDGLKGMVSRNKPKPVEGNDDFLFEFEALARQKQAAGATGTSGVNLTADSTHAPAARPAPAGGEDNQLLLGGVRTESSGDGYAPDSKAMLARINRFWKRIDEGSLQPLFGGPAYQKYNPEHQAKLSSGRSFTVPATSRRF